MRAITELEQRSKEFLKEKKERSELEQRINEMQSQLLGGGGVAPDRNSDEFKAVLREEQERVKAEYEGKIRELEADRQEAEEGRAQVGRYKAVLLKQRDIMIALTARLNERDETIIRMQEELKAYDSEYRRVEDALDAKTAEPSRCAEPRCSRARTRRTGTRISWTRWGAGPGRVPPPAR